jgi:hypothetical protein
MRRAGEDHRQQPAYPANEESGCQEVDEEQLRCTSHEPPPVMNIYYAL